MKLTATFTEEELVKIMSSYIKKKTGKSVLEFTYSDGEFIFDLEEGKEEKEE